jgi:hypothetical protein
VFIGPDQCNDMHGGVNHAIAGHPETPCPFAVFNGARSAPDLGLLILERALPGR